MTISDEPDEDADNLDDDAFVESALTPTPAAKADAGMALPDWPASGLVSRGLMIDPGTVGWFQENHIDWIGQIQAVLQAWVEAHRWEPRPRG
jgi:hypothetical protein